MKHFTKTMTVQEVKNAYRKAAMELHPDKGGSVETMQELNTEFEIAFALAQKLNPAAYDTNAVNKKESASSYRKAFYTTNGWKGSRYDGNLTNKRHRQNYPRIHQNVHTAYRFSIPSDSLSISIALTE